MLAGVGSLDAWTDLRLDHGEGGMRRHPRVNEFGPATSRTRVQVREASLSQSLKGRLPKMPRRHTAAAPEPFSVSRRRMLPPTTLGADVC